MYKVDDGTCGEGRGSWSVRVVPNLLQKMQIMKYNFLFKISSQIRWSIVVLTVSVSTPQPPQGRRLERNL